MTASSPLAPLSMFLSSIFPFSASSIDSWLTHFLVFVATLLACRKLFNKGQPPASPKNADPATAWLATVQEDKFDSIEKQSSNPTSSSTDRDKFLAIFPLLVDTIQKKSEENELPEASLRWIGNMVRYNVVGGKLNRGLQVRESWKAMKRERADASSSVLVVE